jgi:selenocysteine lyase/cysteine desulfurase
MENVERHEALLTTYALERLQAVPGIRLYGASDPHRTHDRVGVIAFNIGTMHHALVAAILGYEGGIGVRSGCFCAQPYVAHLLEGREPDQAFWQRVIGDRDRSRRPGMVRISLGIYNTTDDIDALLEMLQRIARHDYQGNYSHVPESGDCTPVGYEELFPTHFISARSS